MTPPPLNLLCHDVNSLLQQRDAHVLVQRGGAQHIDGRCNEVDADEEDLRPHGRTGEEGRPDGINAHGRKARHLHVGSDLCQLGRKAISDVVPELVGHVGWVIQDRKEVVAPLGLGCQCGLESLKDMRVLLVEWPRNPLVEVFKDAPLPLI